MRLSVRHATLYAYDAPLRFVTQSHRLTPAANAAQSIVEWRVASEGAVFGEAFIDGGGDHVNTMTVHGPVETVEVIVEGLVETTDTAGVLRAHAEIVSPRVYLSPTAATKMSAGLADLRAEALKGAGSELDRAHRLSTAVAEAIAWEAGVTHSHTTAAEALEEGRGVCQDHAHALIALAHASDLPARYVTGYMLTADAVSGEAAHAWAEIHIQGLGWVGFDAANRCCPDDRYIRLGSGRNALEAAPIRGVSRGSGEEAMDVSVEVSNASQSQSQSQQ